MSILYGFYTADEGGIRIKGKALIYRIRRTLLGRGLGWCISILCWSRHLPCWENILLGTENSPLLYAAQRKGRAELLRLEEEYGLSVDPDAKVEDLAVGLQQRVEILKALYRGAEVLVLDEPTGVLTPKEEADHLFRILRPVEKTGKTIVLITHKLREIMAVTDNVCVMRKGEMVASRETKKTNMEELAQLMVGRRVRMGVDKAPVKLGEVRLEVKGLTVDDRRGVRRVKNVSLEVRGGEIVGVAGVAGNGQSELLHAIGGLLPFEGEVLMDGGKLADGKGKDAALVRERGVAHVPEDRHHEGLVLPFLASENGILGVHRETQFSGSIFLKMKSIGRNIRDKIAKYDIRPDNGNLPASSFSGGNQQKIVLAREMECNPDLLLIGQPTRGVDVGAIEFIHKKIIEMRGEGKAILLVCVELDEIRALADRIVVMFDGEIVGECEPETSENELGLMMAGAN